MIKIVRGKVITKKSPRFWEMTPEQRKAWLRENGPKGKAAVTRETRMFVSERDSILRCLDLARMIEFYKRYDKPLPTKDWQHPTVPYAMMHKARLAIGAPTFQPYELDISKAWLKMNGYQEGFFMRDDGPKGETK